MIFCVRRYMEKYFPRKKRGGSIFHYLLLHWWRERKTTRRESSSFVYVVMLVIPKLPKWIFKSFLAKLHLSFLRKLSVFGDFFRLNFGQCHSSLLDVPRQNDFAPEKYILKTICTEKSKSNLRRDKLKSGSVRKSREALFCYFYLLIGQPTYSPH